MRSPKLAILIALAVLLLTPGCALINSLVEYPTPTPRPQRALRPTFTPTAPAPVDTVAEAKQPAVLAEIPTVPAPADQATEPVPPTAEAPTPEPPTPTATPAPIVIVPGEPVRARSGPDITYDQVTELAAGTQLAIVGKNEVGDWWQVCCVDNQPVWVLGELVDEQGCSTPSRSPPIFRRRLRPQPPLCPNRQLSSVSRA